MKKYLAVILIIMLPLTWVWAAGEVTKNVVSPDQQEAEWQPVYGEKGELLNPPPAVQMYRSTEPGELNPPVISTVLLSEDFEDAGWGDPDNPPPGWAVSDSGGEGTQCWHLQDWFKNYYTTWADTNARIYYSGGYTEINFDEWMISPAIILPGGATACSLTWKNYYNDDGAGKDTAYVKITTDGGSNWTNLVVWDQDHTTSPYLETLDITAYAGNTVQIAYVLQCNTGSHLDIYEWKIDKVNIWADAANLLNEEFNNWGPGGDNPPAGWTIIDNGTPKPAQGVWNYNDWHDYTRWGSKTARIYYTSTYAEYQDEWMISPDFTISSAAICSLSMVERYYHSTATTPRYFNEDDHGYILITTNGGTSWNTVYDNDSTKGSTSTAVTFAYDLSSYAGNTCKLAFNFVNSASGYDYWNFDDILVTEQILIADDVTTAAINSPTVGISGYSHNVSAKVVNLGTNTATFQDSVVIDKLNKATYFFEDFSNPQGWTGASPPVNVAGTWAVIDSGDEVTPVWNNNDWHAYYYSTWSDTIARVYYSPIENQNEWLITPSLDFTGQSNLHLTFKQFYNDYSGPTDTGFVFGTANSWATVETLAVYAGADQGSSSSPDFPDFDISSWADNQSAVQIAFNYKANDEFYWYLDKVEVYATLAPTQDYVSGESVVALASLETRDIDYAATWDNPTAGDYQVTSWTNLGADGDNSNDTMSANLTVYEHVETGGPDAGNYSWASDKDGGGGDPYSWIDITTSGTPVAWDYTSSENGYTYGIPLGFSFTFYDVAYDRVYLDKNGLVSFDSITTYINYSNYHIPSTSGMENMLALLWDDLSDESGGTAYYYTNNVDTFIVSYENWDFDLDLNQRIDMQLILTAGDRGIKYQYKEVGPVVLTSHTIGIENDAGNIGLEFVYNGNPMGNIAMSGLAITFGYNPPAIDAALASIDEPADGSVVFNGTSVTPTVTVLNNSDADYAIPVTYLITDGVGDTVYNQSEVTALVTGGGGTLQHAFTLTWLADTDGDYDMEAYTSLAGDANPANDTEIGSFEVATHYGTGGPDDFGYRWVDNSGITAEDPPVFAYIDLSADPLADTAGSGTGAYGTFPIGFSFDFYGDAHDSVNIMAYGYVSFGTASYLTGNDCPIPSSTTPDDPMIMVFWDYPYVNPTYDGACIYRTFGTAPDRYMVIQYHNYRRSSYLMEFEMILHENGNIVYQYEDVDEAGSWGQGQSASIGLQSENVGTRSGLSYLCGTGTPDRPGNILTDGLAIKWYKPVYGHDVVVDQFNVPGPSGIANVAFTPEVLFTNNGNNDETNVPVNLTINPGGYNDVQSIAVLDSGTSVAQQFAQFTPTTSGSYTLVATSALIGDEDPTSDTLTLNFTAYDDLIDFEANDGGLTGSGDWQWGAPNNPEGPANAFSGANVWATNLAGDYTTGIHTLEFDLAVGTTNPSVGVASWYDTEARWDGGNFGVSTDGGSTWITVSPDIGYDDSTRSANPLDPDSIFTGHNQKFWDVVNFDLAAFSGTNVRARFAFGADGSVFYPGWHIDDLAFSDCQIAEGSIAGTVSDNLTDLPVEGAIVTANGTARDTTDVLGEYSFDIGPGEVVVTISKMGYNTDTDTVTVVNGQTTTHDVILTAPIAVFDTSPIDENVAPGDTAVYPTYIYNVGDGPLDYSVSINFAPAPMGIGDIGGVDIRSNSVSEKISNIGRDDNSTDYAPFSYSGGDLPVITDFQDSVFVALLDTSIDTQFLGMEFDGEFFWVTGGGSALDPNKLYKLDSNGNLLATFDQHGTSAWGWRDLAWDGTYLYGSDDGTIDQIDPVTGDTTGVTINGPATTNRALAYNPDTDHFFTANFGSVIDEFGRDGTVYNTWANTKAIYGMAFDGLSEGGPYLWVFSQDGPGLDTLLEISQFEIATGTYTGVSWQGDVPDGYLGGIAGGACFTTEWDASIGALFVLGQGDPMDFIYGYEIATNMTWLSVLSGGSGSVAPGDSAEIVFMVDFRDSTIVPDSTYAADANVDDNSIAPTHVKPFIITASAGGCDYVVGDVNGSDSYNGLDITYGVAFFKGGNDPLCAECAPCAGWWYCGDVNGSCSYNGLDITYGVAYFKGGAGPIPCADCPPIGGPASSLKGNNIKPNEFKSVTPPTFDSKSKTKKGTSRKR